MKKLTIAAITALVALTSIAATFNLAWNTSPTPGVTYRVYSSTNSVNWKFERTTTNLTVTLSNIPSSVIAFGVSATNQNGESGKATAEVIFAPMNLKIVEQ